MYISGAYPEQRGSLCVGDGRITLFPVSAIFKCTSIPDSKPRVMTLRQTGFFLLLTPFLIFYWGAQSHAFAQEIRVEAGMGWGIPLSSIETGFNVETVEEGWISLGDRSLDPGADTHAYGALGFKRSISDNFALGVRGRAQVLQAPGRGSEVFSFLPPCNQDENCTISNRPNAQLRAATVEGRLFLTTIDWIEPYFLVGLGVVQTQMDGVQIDVPSEVQIGSGEESLRGTGAFEFEEVDVMDAGGDVGFGASVPIVGGLSLESELRVTGSLPGSRDSSLSMFSPTIGLSYGVGGQ